VFASSHHIERRELAMMRRPKDDQSQLFYEFHLDDAVPADHQVREIESRDDFTFSRIPCTKSRTTRQRDYAIA
jgi:hypothetical protein